MGVTDEDAQMDLKNHIRKNITSAKSILISISRSSKSGPITLTSLRFHGKSEGT